MAKDPATSVDPAKAEPTTPDTDSEPTTAPVVPEAETSAEDSGKAPAAPTEEPSEPSEVPEEADSSPAEDTTEAADETAPAPAEVPPAGDKDGDAVAEEKARLEREAQDAADEAAEAANEPTPEEEAAPQVSGGPGQIDGSGILTQTNQDVIDNFPRNDQGQVVIGEDGAIEGLATHKQPTQPSGS